MPEQKREDGEGADVHSAARNGAEDSTEESNKQKHHCLPPAKIHNGVECFPFMLPAETKGSCQKMSQKVFTNSGHLFKRKRANAKLNQMHTNPNFF